MDIAKCFKKCVEVVHEYGPWRIFETLCFIVIFIYIIYGMPAMIQKYTKAGNMEASEQIETNKREEHQRLIEYRRKIQPQIDNILEGIINSLNASRAFVIELHNGSNSLQSVPFLKASVTYSANRDNVEDISEEYRDLTVSRFTLPVYLHTHHWFKGSIDELMAVDKKLGTRLAAQGVSYIAIVSLYNEGCGWGYLGLTYNEGDEIGDLTAATKHLSILSQEVTTLLGNHEQFRIVNQQKSMEK